MRFEVCAAFVIGILLPFLETCRRGIGHWTIETMTMLEDYAAGALLLFAAILSTRGRPSAPLWMLGAWSAVTMMMTNSFAYQLEETLRGEAIEPRNALVLLVKFLLWGTCAASLFSPSPGPAPLIRPDRVQVHSSFAKLRTHNQPSEQRNFPPFCHVT